MGGRISSFVSAESGVAALLVEGTAFRKIARLDPAKLKTSTTAGVALLVETIGGSWGSTEIEERYEYFEKALYGTVQKPDESHDSFLARMENNFVELISRNTTLEEVQAYVLLRQSTLQADDKKRILLEHQGDLKYKPVVKSFRLLGSKFFNEFQSGKTASKTKVYDVNFTEEHDTTTSFSMNASEPALAFQASVDEGDGDIDGEFLEALVASEDPDAMLVASFETELEEFMQDVPGMCEAMTTYVGARAKLLEKKKGRGFWPIKGGGKSKFSKSRGRGGKGKVPEIVRTCWRGLLAHIAAFAVNLDIGKPNVLQRTSCLIQARQPVQMWRLWLRRWTLNNMPLPQPKFWLRPPKCSLSRKTKLPSLMKTASPMHLAKSLRFSLSVVQVCMICVMSVFHLFVKKLS